MSTLEMVAWGAMGLIVLATLASIAFLSWPVPTGDAADYQDDERKPGDGF